MTTFGPNSGQDPYSGWGQPGSGGFPQQGPGPYSQPTPGGYPQQQPPPPQHSSEPFFPGSPQQQSPYPPYGGPQGQFGGHHNNPFQSPIPEMGKKKPLVLWIVTGVIVLALVAVGILGFVTPGFFNKKVFDNAAVQDGVSKMLKDYYKVNPSAVSCPTDQEVKAGSTFTCTVTINGQQQKVTNKITTDDGHYEVGQPQ